jgi:hypothetical protein
MRQIIENIERLVNEINEKYWYEIPTDLIIGDELDSLEYEINRLKESYIKNCKEG